jgi:NAD(P)-dependent dehydrogenase (short-subunit alcohol dehydrogenase family)
VTDRELTLDRRTAIVTGASRGIGAAIALRLASEGAHVVIGARSLDSPTGTDEGSLADTAESIRAIGGTVTPLTVDVTDADSREAFIAQALDVTGGIDILVNNAGGATYHPAWTYPLDEVVRHLELNFLSSWHLSSLLIPRMIQWGRGWILNLGSTAAVKVPEQPPYDQYLGYFGHNVIYGTVKAALHRYSRGLAAEVYEHNIAVNVLAPVGGVYTDALRNVAPEFTPDHPAVEPIENMAEAALALVSARPQDQTGVIAWSHQYLSEIGRSTWSLDGQQVLVQR